MTNAKTTRKALVSSMVALLICFAMLLGTTFAWFTDSVSSTNNIIKSGNLDVEVYYGDPAEKNSIKDVNTLFNGVTLWEPGAVAYENLTVKNVGSLAFTYALSVNYSDFNYVQDANGDKYDLTTALKVAVLSGDEITDAVTDALTNNNRTALINNIASTEWKTISELINEGENGILYSANDAAKPNQDSRDYIVVIYWQPSASDNNWNVNNGKHTYNRSDVADGLDYLFIDLGINLVATQYAYEKDSFDETYDAAAKDAINSASGILPTNASAIEIHVRDISGRKVGSMVIPAGAIDDPAETIEVTYSKTDDIGNITVADNMETLSYDITVTNLKADNTTPIKAYIRIDAGIDEDTIKLYHNGTEITSFIYDPHSGYVIFETTSFSPFTVVYDADSEYVPPVTEGPGENGENPSDLPKATVVNSPEYEDVDLPWGSYGAWSPTAGLDSQLEAAYTFTCEDTSEEAKASPYADWYCDFYVKLDKDLGENQIFLGGNYGSFGWVGFHNGDVTLEANAEIPLLGSIAGSWTYEAVATSVGTFICGVGDVNDALSGATFTVMLRLTNPEDATEFYNVAEITYTFK